MAEHNGINKITALRQRWINYRIIADTLLSAALALFVGSICFYIFSLSAAWGILVFVLSLGVLLYIHQPWKITPASITAFLNLTYPEMEESSELLLKPTTGLNILEKLQLSKVENAIANIPALPTEFTRPLKRAGLFVAASLIVTIAAAKTGHLFHSKSDTWFAKADKTAASKPAEKILPQISSVDITVNPPAYINKPSRTQDKFTLSVEEGATVKWQVSTNIAIKNAELIFNEHERIPLHSSDQTNWTAQKEISKPGFYQVNIDGKLSDLYQVEVIKDSPPVIRIKTPKQYTYIDAGETPKVNMTATIIDDYGISNAIICATVAKGSGEGVKFKEYKIPFDQSFAQHSPQYNLQKLFDLPKLDMEPGDELYFYIQGLDTHQQQSRTDVYIVSIQDTAQLLSMDGIVTGANLKPEYFRSQRQIILDTEKLLKEKDSISVEKFNAECNAIGIDQKMLRLRYGKFLGEEEENTVGESGQQAELSKVENFNNAAMVLDAYTDKHDNAEDATFLEPAIKAQLKATLTEMWNSELHLRLYKPTEALPFEYKALRLLKDLQQKSRSYVAKTAYNPPALKMEKRLSGELGKIGQPVNQEDIKQQADQFESLKKAIGVLEQLKTVGSISSSDKHILQVAGQQLSARASAQPGAYLASVSAMRRIMADDNQRSLTDMAIVERAIQKTLPLSKQMPQSSASSSADLGLSQGYYKNLNRTNR